MPQWNRPTGPLKSLIEAAAWGNTEAVNRFLAAGADVNARDAYGWTALHHAVGYGNTPGMDIVTSRAPVREVVDILLKAGAALNAVDRDGDTPLAQAVSAGHEEAARWLIAAGADLTPKDKWGGTVLTHALWYKHSSKGFVQLLRQKRAPVNLLDALWLGDSALALRMVEQADVSTVGPNGFMYLHLAALLGNTRVVARLIVRKAKVNLRADYGWTALHLACGGIPGESVPGGNTFWEPYGTTTGRKELVQLLLKSGASKNPNDSRHRTPKDWAVGLNRKELIPLLR